MKKNSFLAITLVSILSGCATLGQLEDNLNVLVGHQESEVFSALGYPDGKQEFGTDTIYVWGRSQNTTLFLPQSHSTTRYIGNTPIFGTTTTTQAIPINYNCTIKVIVNSGKVKSWEYMGNLGGCEPYIERLNGYFGR